MNTPAAELPAHARRSPSDELTISRALRNQLESVVKTLGTVERTPARNACVQATENAMAALESDFANWLPKQNPPATA